MNGEKVRKSPSFVPELRELNVGKAHYSIFGYSCQYL
ncbi:hypothetical protein M6B38_264125 [Iris pallida]|uniref:Uncharacterized protein n=1 Tax=Iris pallida TaxID=29817 RepID=A0AAX6ID01_IRIPA|nr:hypothetical protein M6B38_264125 [Iris pallida]